MRSRRAVTLVVVSGLAFLSSAARADHQRAPHRAAVRVVPAVLSAPRRPSRAGAVRPLRPRRYSRRSLDVRRYRDVVLPGRANGAHFRLLVPIGSKRTVFIERTRTTAGGLATDYSILGLAGRTYRRRIHCRAGNCDPDQIDPRAYREVSLGEHGTDRYLLLVPRSGSGTVFIERVVGVGNFADVSVLDL